MFVWRILFLSIYPTDKHKSMELEAKVHIYQHTLILEYSQTRCLEHIDYLDYNAHLFKIKSRVVKHP